MQLYVGFVVSLFYLIYDSIKCVVCVVVTCCSNARNEICFFNSSG